MLPRNPGRTRRLGAPQTDVQLSGTLRKSPADGRGGLLAQPHMGSGMCSALMCRASPGLLLLKSPFDSGGQAGAGGGGWALSLLSGLLGRAKTAHVCPSARRSLLQAQTYLIFPSYFYCQVFSSELIFFHLLLLSLIKTFWIIPL